MWRGAIKLSSYGHGRCLKSSKSLNGLVSAGNRWCQSDVSSKVASARESVPKGRSGRWLHVSPSGDCFIGDEMFAAKHLSSGYLRSIKLSDAHMKEFEENVEEWYSQAPLKELQGIYDSGDIPPSFPKV